MVAMGAAVYHTMRSGTLIYIHEAAGETSLCISCDVDGSLVGHFHIKHDRSRPSASLGGRRCL